MPSFYVFLSREGKGAESRRSSKVRSAKGELMWPDDDLTHYLTTPESTKPGGRTAADESFDSCFLRGDIMDNHGKK